MRRPTAGGETDRGNIVCVTATGPGAAYESIGGGYGSTRRAEPSWQRTITAALGRAETIVNIGAGSGSYEPDDKGVVAVEPSAVMLGQRRARAAPSARAVAEALPFRDGTFDAALAVLTVHHWTAPIVGLQEMRRVAARQIVATWDPAIFAATFWFARDYLPEALERESTLATLLCVVDGLGPNCDVIRLEVPADCVDGFFAAYWARPHAYLNPRVRAAISGIALLPEPVVARAVKDLAGDLSDGSWAARYAYLDGAASLDLGYRMVVASR